MNRFRGYISPNRRIRSDPINLVFFGVASASDVADHLQNYTQPRWHPADRWRSTRPWPTSPMQAYIDDRQNGGTADWKLPDLELALGPMFSGPRFHIRVYESAVPDRPTAASEPDFGRWSIAAVHREHWSAPAYHFVHGWMEPREYLQEYFAGKAGVGQVYSQDLGEAGWYQGYWFDGQATFVELL